MSDSENSEKNNAAQKKTPKSKKRKFGRKYVRSGAKKVTDKDVENVVEKADEIKDKFKRGGPLGRFLEDAQLLIALVQDYWRREYREIPYSSLAAVVFTLAYVFNPLDLIPDTIPVLGLLDDAAVVSICLIMVEQDLHDYKAWRDGGRNGSGGATGGA